MAFERNSMIFVFNFHPEKSFSDYMFDAPPGEYKMVFNSDDILFGGQGRLKKDQVHFTMYDPERSGKQNLLSIYLPNRTAIILQLVNQQPVSELLKNAD